MNHSNSTVYATPKQSPAYDRAQNVVGQPVSEALQVDESVNSLGEAVDFHMEIVRVLLRRLHPVTGDMCEAACGESGPQRTKVPLAMRIDNRRDELQELTGEVRDIIRALQI